MQDGKQQDLFENISVLPHPVGPGNHCQIDQNNQTDDFRPENQYIIHRRLSFPFRFSVDPFLGRGNIPPGRIQQVCFMSLINFRDAVQFEPPLRNI